MELIFSSRGFGLADPLLKPKTMKETTIEDVLKKEIHIAFMVFDNTKKPLNLIVESLVEKIMAASLNRQGWTRVEDGLPDYGTPCLVFGQSKMGSPQMGGSYIMMGERVDLIGTAIENERNRFTDKYGFKHMAYVTHWMPLPNKPSI